MTFLPLKICSVVTSFHCPSWRVRKVTWGTRLPSEFGSMGFLRLSVSIGYASQYGAGRLISPIDYGYNFHWLPQSVPWRHDPHRAQVRGGAGPRAPFRARGAEVLRHAAHPFARARQAR